MITAPSSPVGDLLREWRQRRNLSQLDLACEAGISSRHLSFLETGRSQPSREMVLHLSEQLDIPLRARNVLLAAAGFAPVFPERSLDDPALHEARQAIDMLLTGHMPYPALAVDRHWSLLTSNEAFAVLLAGVDRALLTPPINVLRLGLHPAGLAPRIVNYAEWRAHLFERLRRQVEMTRDPELRDLMEELSALPGPQENRRKAPVVTEYGGIMVPFQLLTEAGTLSFFSTTTLFGTPRDITLSELAIEAFFPADAVTADRMRLLSDKQNM